MRETLQAQQITIECPNTIFHLYIRTENEMSKLDLYAESSQGGEAGSHRYLSVVQPAEDTL